MVELSTGSATIGSVNVNAGSANIGDVDVLTIAAGTTRIGGVYPVGMRYIDESGTVLTVKDALIDVATTGDNQLVTAVTNKILRVLSYYLVCAGAVTVQFQDDAGANLTGDMSFAANGGISVYGHHKAMLDTGSGQGLDINLSGNVAVSGWLCYVEV